MAKKAKSKSSPTVDPNLLSIDERVAIARKEICDGLRLALVGILEFDKEKAHEAMLVTRMFSVAPGVEVSEETLARDMAWFDRLQTEIGILACFLDGAVTTEIGEDGAMLRVELRQGPDGAFHKDVVRLGSLIGMELPKSDGS